MCAYFRITVKEKKKTHKGIREMDADIERAYLHFERKIKTEYRESDVISFEIVQLTKISPEVKRYLQKTKRPPIVQK